MDDFDDIDELLSNLNNSKNNENNIDNINNKCEIVSNNPNELGEIYSKQLKRIAERYGDVFEKIIKDCDKDRNQAQEVIDNIMNVLRSEDKVPRVYVEKITDAIKVKNEIALTAIKALDALPKLISATKGNELFKTNIGMVMDPNNLKNILDIIEKENNNDDE